MFDAHQLKPYDIQLSVTGRKKATTPAWIVEVSGRRARRAFFRTTEAPARTVKIGVLDTGLSYALRE